MKTFSISLIILFSTFFSAAIAQETQVLSDPDAAVKQARLLFQQEKYSLAYPYIKHVYQTGYVATNMPLQQKEEVQFLYISCGLQMGMPEMVALAEDFLKNSNQPAYEQLIAYYLGEYFYQQKNYASAISNFSQGMTCG